MATDEPRIETTPDRRPLFFRFRDRILSGLFLALPVVAAIAIVSFLYNLFRSYVLDPITDAIQHLRGVDEVVAQTPEWWRVYVAPLISLALVVVLLYLLGLFVQSRIYHIVNRVVLRVPVVTTVYQAVLSVFEALESRRVSNQYKRVVLVEFPHPGMRSIGLVTSTLKDQGTGRSILGVCVLTGIMPPSGFTLFVPEESVTDLDWTLNQALQSIVSGGITAPPRIRYFREGEVPPAPPRQMPL
jgi:uncharacterized membrane protein